MILFLCTLLSNLSLEQAEQIALSQNKQIQVTDQEVKQYEMRNWQSTASWLPNLVLNSQFVNMQKKQTVFLNALPKQYVMSQLAITQPLFSTDLIYGLRSSRLYLENTITDQQIARNDILLQLRVAYYSVVLHELSLKVQEEVIDYLKAALEDTEKKLGAGKSTSFEVNQNKVDLSNAH